MFKKGLMEQSRKYIREGRDMMKSLDIIANEFVVFSVRECEGSSLLYAELANGVSSDIELLELCQNARPGQPIPNLFFGSVHYLLLKGRRHPLEKFYPSIVSHPKNPQGAFPVFKKFCLSYKDEIVHLLKEKLVQTNEVRRCGYLYPIFSKIYERTNNPLALMEIGTSAGFQLLWDKYVYSYGSDDWYGNSGSHLKITMDIKGDNFPEVAKQSPKVGMRIGFDLNIVDLRNKEDKLWLRSLIWPEHKERVAMFNQAVDYVLHNELSLIEGNGLDLINRYVDDIPLSNTLCVYHTHVANQLSIDDKKLLLRKIETIGATRNVYHIYNNIQDAKLHLDYYENGKGHFSTVAETDSHGWYFSWLI